mgnify:CR=1 FL=1
MSLEFTLCLISLFLFAGIGMPVAYAILLASLVYLFLGGQSIGIAGKTLMDGVYQSFILLAVPLFIVAANIMNAGTISDRLLRFCVGLVGRFKGGMGHVNVVASLIFSGMSGSAVADAAGIGKVIIDMMVKSITEHLSKVGRGYNPHLTPTTRRDSSCVEASGCWVGFLSLLALYAFVFTSWNKRHGSTGTMPIC